jgi:hypothetical protein
VQVHYGVANHADPESCAAYREVCGEALDAFIAAPIGRCLRGVSSSRKRMGERGRLGSLRQTSIP